MNPDDDLPLRPRGYPKTRDEWWRFAEAYRAELRDLVAEFHPACARWARPMRVTAPAAQAACDVVSEDIEKKSADDPLECFDQFLAQKSAGLVHLLNEVWFGVPESRDAHSLPGFGVLCDLCSESWVLETEEEL